MGRINNFQSVVATVHSKNPEHSLVTLTPLILVIGVSDQALAGSALVGVGTLCIRALFLVRWGVRCAHVIAVRTHFLSSPFLHNYQSISITYDQYVLAHRKTEVSNIRPREAPNRECPLSVL